MLLRLIFLLIFLSCCGSLQQIIAQDIKDYRKNVRFILFRPNDVIPENNQGLLSTFNDSLEAQGCPRNANVSILVTGWLDNSQSLGVHSLLINLQKASRGCVIFVDHSYFTRNIVIFTATDHILPISTVIAQKIRQIGNYDRIFMFGISMGAHIAIDAAYRSAVKGAKINRLEVCDTASLPLYDNPYLLHSMEAAKSVSCIHTSRLGKSDMKCHQNFRLGHCGYEQNFGIPFNRMNSHAICQILYNIAFTKDFIPKLPSEMRDNCVTNETMPIADIKSSACQGVKFGYSANYDRENCRGNFFIETDDVIKDKEVIGFLKQKERHFEIEDIVLLMENTWNRILLSRMRSKPRQFPYK